MAQNTPAPDTLAPDTLAPVENAQAETARGQADGAPTDFDRAVAAYDAGDYAAAFALFQRLGNRGDVSALRNVGHMLRKGLGVPQNLKAARQAYRRAADIGHTAAMANLGLMILNGEGGPADARTATRWFYRGARAANPQAQFLLARQLEAGEGVTRDRTAALAYYLAAARQGQEDAQVAADRLAANGIVLPAFAARPAGADGAREQAPASNSPRKDINTLLKGTGLDAADPPPGGLD